MHSYRVLDYNTDVNDALDKRKSASNLLRFGAEIETGWHDNHSREKFFNALASKELDKVSIAKFDRSIESEHGAEIVTLPMTLPTLSKGLLDIGEILRENVDKSSMASCGVHIHATRDPMHTDQFWRVVSAIMVDNGCCTHWFNFREANHDQKKWDAAVEGINEFWTRIALRRPTQHCRRVGYQNVKFADSKADHSKAVIRGKHTPTVEFRLFKSARSPIVLASYAEVVGALIAFADKPPEDLLEPESGNDKMKAHLEAQKKVWDMLVEWGHIDYYFNARGTNPAIAQYPKHFQSICDRLVAYIVNGYSYVTILNDYAGDRTQAENAFRFPITMAQYSEVRKLREALVSPERQLHPGARAWKGHLFPVQEFIRYITHNGETYPNLAERMELPKFRVLVGGLREEVGTDPTPFNNHVTHAAIKVGCLIRHQGGDPTYYRVTETSKKPLYKAIVAEDYIYTVRAITGTVGTSPANEVYQESYGDYSFTGDQLIHLCTGATLKEGHDE